MEMLQEFSRVLAILEGHMLDPAWKKTQTCSRFFTCSQAAKLMHLKVLPLQPPMQACLHSSEAAIPYHLHQGILL